MDNDFPIDRFSGGEQDDIAVALRIALSRSLAGLHQVHESTFLIFDEIFGSQDEGQRNQPPDCPSDPGVPLSSRSSSSPPSWRSRANLPVRSWWRWAGTTRAGSDRWSDRQELRKMQEVLLCKKTYFHVR
jgi:hypothetical protein